MGGPGVHIRKRIWTGGSISREVQIRQDTGVPVDLDPPKFGPPVQIRWRIWTPRSKSVRGYGPPVQIRWRIWTPRSKSVRGYGPPSADLDPPTKLSENIILNVLVKMDDTLRSSAY